MITKDEVLNELYEVAKYELEHLKLDYDARYSRRIIKETIEEVVDSMLSVLEDVEFAIEEERRERDAYYIPYDCDRDYTDEDC